MIYYLTRPKKGRPSALQQCSSNKIWLSILDVNDHIYILPKVCGTFLGLVERLEKTIMGEGRSRQD